MSLPIQIPPFSSDAIQDILPLPEPTIARDGWEGFHFDNSLVSSLLRLNETDQKSLPGIEPSVFSLDLRDVPLPDLSAPSSSSVSDAESEPLEVAEEQPEQDEAINIWVLPEVLQKKPQSELVSWDTFLNEKHAEPTSSSLSEVHPRTFSSILALGNKHTPSRTVKPTVLLNAFFELGLGRSSALFAWNEEDGTFTKRLESVAAEGYSLDLVQNLFETLSKTGMSVRRLNESFGSSTEQLQPASSCRIAFMSASRSALYAIHRFVEISRPGIGSLLQLKVSMGKIEGMVSTLLKCADATQSCPTDHSIVAGLMKQAADACMSRPGVVKVLQAIFSRTCRPILEHLSNEIGLSSMKQARSGELSPANAEAQNLWDALFHTELYKSINETQESLSLLRLYAPDCPVLSIAEYGTSTLSTLELGYTFGAVCELQSRSVAYEDAIRSSIVSAGSSSSASSIHTPASDTFSFEELGVGPLRSDGPFQLNTGLFSADTPLFEATERDEVFEQVMEYLEGFELDFSPLQLDLEQGFALSINPLVSAQHRLLSYSILEVLFQQFGLIEHLNLQRDFQLFRNASFSSRLGTALFDSDENSGEGRRRTGAPTGLRLQARETWPPASSELRLVLMGILSDSLTVSKKRALENSISFAIRDMAPEELEKCRDVESIYALDFLRLHYRPPNDVLETILTTSILDQYDRLFQHLLRVLRLHSVTQSLVTEKVGFQGEAASTFAGHKVAVEMHHFVTTWADYCHNTAIELRWQKFEGILRHVQSLINNKDYDRTLHIVKSQDYLRALHERTLDSILDDLLLKHRQSKVRELLEGIYSTILEFAAARRSGTDTDATTDENTTRLRRLEGEFRAHVVRFMHALRGLEQASHYSQRHAARNMEDGEEQDNVWEYLLVRLDMFGYWDK